MRRVSSSSSPERPYWKICAAVALAVGALTLLVLLLPGTVAVTVAVVAAVMVTAFVVMIWLNPAHRLWRMSSGCFGVACSVAIVPHFQFAVKVGGLALLLRESGQSVVLAGMFLLASLAFAALALWQRTAPENGVIVTDPSTLVEALRLARADPSEAMAAGYRAIGGQTGQAGGDTSSRSRQVALAIVLFVAAIAFGVLTFLLLRSSAERSPALALARSRRGR